MRQEHTCPQLLRLRLRYAERPSGVRAHGPAISSVWVLNGRAFALSEETHGVYDGETGLYAEYITEIQFCPFCGVNLGAAGG